MRVIRPLVYVREKDLRTFAEKVPFLFFSFLHINFLHEIFTTPWKLVALTPVIAQITSKRASFELDCGLCLCCNMCWAIIW